MKTAQRTLSFVRVYVCVCVASLMKCVAVAQTGRFRLMLYTHSRIYSLYIYMRTTQFSRELMRPVNHFYMFLVRSFRIRAAASH